MKKKIKIKYSLLLISLLNDLVIYIREEREKIYFKKEI